ncbi:hypothetical protein CIPAW_03G028800 [Carya illinoinensis]|uniref:Uncharacterized protein n=1 Tax=Carya illinoinensis TaxID=32201 RepID=A0A8T1QY53_CARIL|nr:hypothetical protein CIPAW_03G028800 [Carya illinoinensis]
MFRRPLELIFGFVGHLPHMGHLLRVGHLPHIATTTELVFTELVLFSRWVTFMDIFQFLKFQIHWPFATTSTIVLSKKSNTNRTHVSFSLEKKNRKMKTFTKS